MIAGPSLQELRRMFGELPVVRVATVGPDGAPHAAALWFVWQEDGIYLAARQSGSTWSDAANDPRISAIFDVGRTWGELAGVVLSGPVELLPMGHPVLRDAMSAWHEKYRSLFPGAQFAGFAEEMDDLGFLRLRPEVSTWWDHADRRG
ncbi:MAG: pyridoxamine 5'-phosphate oxidase family protein [Actinobacteria bacterium]|nr:pyridoxamine 5'-phosphate oxidase family protein [Actinomycetota bacterium]